MEALITQLAQNGLLGLLLALSITINIVQYKANQSLQENRVKDLKESRDIILEPIKGIKTTVEIILGLLQTQLSGLNNNKRK